MGMAGDSDQRRVLAVDVGGSHVKVLLSGGTERRPVNLGEGWAGFGFEQAFGKPTKVVNDAAMQALGSYEGGRMLFLGFGTGLGSSGLERLGKKGWRKEVADVAAAFSAALEPDYVVLGGGNAKLLKELPPNARLGANENAFLGGFRLWKDSPTGD